MPKIKVSCHFIKGRKSKLYFAVAVMQNSSFSKIIFKKYSLPVDIYTISPKYPFQLFTDVSE